LLKKKEPFFSAQEKCGEGGGSEGNYLTFFTAYLQLKRGYKMANLDNLYKWFDKNRGGIIKGHEGEYVLLKSNAVISYFQDDNAALEYAQKSGFPMGSFLIQECISKEEECMYYYNEAVSFG
jgi:hypothetical protein